MNIYENIKSVAVVDCLAKASITIPRYKSITVAVSGGSDSDLVVDVVERTKEDWQEITYVWFDTGLEYQATKDHLKYLEDKYGIQIQRVKANKSIPTCVREFGVPFLSKYASEMLNRLQMHGSVRR